MFLTLEDPRAQVQGSVDPLGLERLWSNFGRKVVTNLTTATTSVRGFTILLLARYLTQRLIEGDRVGEEDALPIFLRVEQMGAYARYIGNDVEEDIRGITRVKKFAGEDRNRVPIFADKRGMILSDQKTYGLWGLYSVASRASGLAEDGPVGLTPYAREFIETTYGKPLRSVEGELWKLAQTGGWLNTRTDAFKTLARLLSEDFSEVERSFYAEVLRDGARVKDAPQGRQARFASLLRDHTDLDMWLGHEEMTTLTQKARVTDEALAERLDRIVRLESTIALADRLFAWLQTQDGQEPALLASTLTSRWGSRLGHLEHAPVDDLLPEIREFAGDEIAAALKRTHLVLVSGDYGEAIDALLDWNQLVQQGRKAAPWVRMGENGTLDVRYRGREEELPDGNELPALWRHPYFIDSLKAVTNQLEPA